MSQAASTEVRHTQTHVAEYKKEIVKDLANLIDTYPIVGLVNIENLPAPQLQAMRAQLRGKFHITMTKKRLVRLAFEQTKAKKKHIEKLDGYLTGMPALIFTRENPFKLSRTLQKNKSPAPAKPGQVAPRDIIVNKGPTSFAPGPIIGELAMAGIKAGVEGGKVAIKEDAVVVKSGEKIKPKVAEILARLGIQPMEVGLDLVAVYENGLIYGRDILSIDEKEYLARLSNAARWAFSLSFNAGYPTKQNISLLVGKAHNDAKSLGISQKIFDAEVIEALLGRAEQQMLSLKTIANIPEKAHIEEKKEETAQKTIQTEIKAPTREELEANIKMREKEREMKEIENIAKEIQKKAINGHEKKKEQNK